MTEDNKPRISQTIVVEGRYDANTLRQIVDGYIFVCDGFAIFNNTEKMALLRRLAARQGVIILTDSDGAGALIRSKLQSALPPEQLKNAYIPDLPGKERRKRRTSAEGLLGVEGMTREIILAALHAAGADIDGQQSAPSGGITQAMMYEDGYLGRPDSAARREQLQKRLNLPSKMSTKELLKTLNRLYTADEYTMLTKENHET